MTNFCFVFLSLYYISESGIYFIFLFYWVLFLVVGVLFSSSFFFFLGGGEEGGVLGDQKAVFVHHEGFGIKWFAGWRVGVIFFLKWWYESRYFSLV